MAAGAAAPEPRPSCPARARGRIGRFDMRPILTRSSAIKLSDLQLCSILVPYTPRSRRRPYGSLADNAVRAVTRTV
jgi:hypothetical protein